MSVVFGDDGSSELWLHVASSEMKMVDRLYAASGDDVIKQQIAAACLEKAQRANREQRKWWLT